MINFVLRQLTLKETTIIKQQGTFEEQLGKFENSKVILHKTFPVTPGKF